MNKLVNDPADVVADSLRGLAAAHPARLRVDHDRRLVLRHDAPRPGKVALVSGGGSGHEPLHSGYVGLGMLDAAVVGEIFTSPTPDQILAATQAVDGGAGVLHVVKNYTGDVMNFEMAAELAGDLGVEVATVVVDDDVAVTDSTHTAGRRGTGLTVLLEKLVGAAAEEGQSLSACHALATRINAAGRSMGLALSPCTVPAVGRPSFELGDHEVEVGIGIHGEPGRERRPAAPAHELAAALTDPVLAEVDAGPAIVMVNGMGATPLIELYVMFAEVERLLAAAGVTAVRTVVGNQITALDMAGCSLTVLPSDEELVRLWDAPVDTTALRWGI